MRLTRGVFVLAASLAVTACDGPAFLQMAVNPLSVLELELVPAVDTLVPGDHVPVTITVRNPASVPIEVGGYCGTLFEVIAPSGEVLSGGGSWGCSQQQLVLGPHDTLTFSTGWSGLWWVDLRTSEPLAPGTYRLRPYMLHGHMDRHTGRAAPVTIQPWAIARFVHTGPLPPLDILVGGRRRATAVAPGFYSGGVAVPVGPQRVEVRDYIDDALIGSGEIVFGEGVTHTVALRVGPAGIEPVDVTDPAVATAPNEGRLRVAHFAASAPRIDVFLIQPESLSPVPLMTSFPYGTASPYRSSVPGKWTVIVTAQGRGEVLVRTAPIPILAGQVRTLMLMDGVRGGMFGALLEP